MSSTTKKTKISEEHKKIVDSFQTTQELYNDLDEYLRTSNKNTDVVKNRLAKEISDLGDMYVKEIESKPPTLNINTYEVYASKVETIIKNHGNKFGSLKELNDMTYDEIDIIYEKAEIEQKKGFFTKLLDFFMGW